MATTSSNSSRLQLTKVGVHQVPLARLWELLPAPDRQEIGWIVPQMIARQVLPSDQKEGSHDSD
jgi:hypothetical protein